MPPTELQHPLPLCALPLGECAMPLDKCAMPLGKCALPLGECALPLGKCAAPLVSGLCLWQNALCLWVNVWCLSINFRLIPTCYRSHDPLFIWIAANEPWLSIIFSMGLSDQIRLPPKNLDRFVYEEIIAGYD